MNAFPSRITDPTRPDPTRPDPTRPDPSPMDWSLVGRLIADYESDSDKSCTSATSYKSNDHDGLTDFDSDCDPLQ